MRFMIIIKTNAESEAGMLPPADMIDKMAKFHQELADAGVLVDASGLRPTSLGWRVKYQGGHTSLVDGPFAETKELIGGYTIIRVKGEQEAREWTRRFPNPSLSGGDCHIEVRRMFELEDFEPGPGVETFRNIPGSGRPARSDDPAKV
jgi:hypothetical protein